MNKTTIELAIDDLNLLEKILRNEITEEDIDYINSNRYDFLRGIRIGKIGIRQNIENIKLVKDFIWEKKNGTEKNIQQN